MGSPSWTEVNDPGQHFAMEFLPTILLILSLLSTFALLLSAFLVINVITAILTQQTRQIGVMKAVGADPRQLTVLYLRMVLIFGLCALVLAAFYAAATRESVPLITGEQKQQTDALDQLDEKVLGPAGKSEDKE